MSTTSSTNKTSQWLQLFCLHSPPWYCLRQIMFLWWRLFSAGPLNSTTCFGVMYLTNWDLAVPVAACISLSVTLNKSPLSFIRVFPHLKAGAVQLSVISNFSTDCSTKTTLSLFNSKAKLIQQQFHSSPKKRKTLFNQFPCLLFLYL